MLEPVVADRGRLPGVQVREIPFAALQLRGAAPFLADSRNTAVLQALETPSRAPQS